LDLLNTLRKVEGVKPSIQSPADSSICGSIASLRAQTEAYCAANSITDAICIKLQRGIDKASERPYVAEFFWGGSALPKTLVCFTISQPIVLSCFLLVSAIRRNRRWV
jgi:hypothetical protein